MRVFAIRQGDKVKIILGKRHFLRDATTKEGEKLFNLCKIYKDSQDELDLEALEAILDPFGKYVRSGQFRRDGDVIYLGDLNIPLPNSLSKTISEYLEAGYPIQPLVNFWNWALLNPNEEARDRFFEYCENYGVTITDSGMAILYKAVTHKEKCEINLAHFIATAYLQAKRSAAKKENKGSDPSKIAVFSDKDHSDQFYTELENSRSKGKKNYLGNLRDLFVKVDELSGETSNSYTDKHTRTMDLRLGVPAFKKREECDPNIANECSYGLHVGSYKYVSRFGNGSDTIFACLVNPMNVVALPNYDNSKIRVCEYLPYAIMNVEGEDWEELDSEFFEEEYTPYIAKSLKTLSDLLDNFSLKEDDPLFKLTSDRRQAVKTQLVYLSDMAKGMGTTLAKSIKNAEDPVEAPSDSVLFDVNDVNGQNKLEKINSAKEHSIWKKQIESGETTGSFDTWMKARYAFNPKVDLYGDSVTVKDEFGRVVLTPEEMTTKWKKEVSGGETGLGLDEYVEAYNKSESSGTTCPYFFDAEVAD